MAAKKKAKQEDLPGLENREIKELNEAAQEYAAIRDERQALTLKEVALKADLLNKMHRRKMTDYVYEDIEIHVVTEEETVKVKIKKKKDDGDDGTAVDMS